jgi:NDP-sugar pyrophosphorylase family protein
MGKTAMILAAGEGTRLLPLTKDLPKALVKFHGIPMIEILIRKLIGSGFTRIVINVHHLREQIIDFVTENKGFGADIIFSPEEILLDTGGGIKKAANLLGKEPVLFHNVDILTDIDLHSYYSGHLEWGGGVSLVIKDRPTSRYLLFNKDMFLSGWYQPDRRVRIISRKSKGGYIETAFSGIYIINPSLFKSFPEYDVFSLTPWLVEQSGHVDMAGWDQGDSYWYDLGNAGNLEAAQKNLIKNPGDEYTFIRPED